MSVRKQRVAGGGARPIQLAMRALADDALVRTMRQGEGHEQPAAWAEFFRRFRPLLEEYARRIGVPDADRSACVGEVLDEEAVRLTSRAVVLPQLNGYLVRAVRHRWLRLKRDAATRQRVYREAVFDPDASEHVVGSLCSTAALRASRDPVGRESSHASPAISRWVALVRKQLTDEEIRILGWAGDMVTRREMAEWLGTGYEATRRRVTRLLTRVRNVAHVCALELGPAERDEVRRFLRRAGALPDDGGGMPASAAGGSRPSRGERRS